MPIKPNIAKNFIYIIFFAINVLIASQFSAVTVLSAKIAGLFAFPENLVHWITDAYLMATVISLLFFLASAKYIERHIKRKNFFFEGIIYFSLGSLFCHLAGSDDLFIFGRIIEGLGAGIILFLQLTTPAVHQDKSHLRYFWAILGLGAGFLAGNLLTNSQLLTNLFWNSFLFGLVVCLISTISFRNVIFDFYEGFCRLMKLMYLKRIRIGTIAVGHGLYALLSWIFDNPFYIFMLAVYGPLKGGLTMTILSLVISYGFVIFYNWSKIDWLGINVIEKIKNDGLEWTGRLKSKSLVTKMVAYFPFKIFRIIVWSLRKGNIAAFFALSVFEDPFIATIYLRKGSFDNLSQRDFGIFFSSVIVSNGYWIARNTAIIEIAREIWKVLG
jgi:hypothetical protein